MSLLWTLIVGGIIGWIAGAILGKDVPFGIIGNIVVGFIGAWLGGLVLGNLGPDIGGFAIIPAIIGAVIFVFLLSLVLRGMRKAS
ncbi:GlsB/YeaQ/YmgE family stress response membrane protein [Bacillus massiliigorillae]|uniref:GlsB/YeaQ/YmgE family stress response membrane protein n=1 Tax=Bacillus massiliigorillae TaxID=1243664 RepID=UPI0005A87FFA|nr:GlsB/YeaQ/YmgE family stress response membrane protein [Bacillus massiliigorillae]